MNYFKLEILFLETKEREGKVGGEFIRFDTNCQNCPQIFAFDVAGSNITKNAFRMLKRK